MNDIIFDSRKIKVYEDLKYLVEYTGKDSAFLDSLWEGMLINSGLYEEFLYYIDNHCFKDELRVSGLSLTDMYVYRLSQYNVRNDSGKHNADCNKESMVLESFMELLKVINNPDDKKRFERGRGMDTL